MSEKLVCKSCGAPIARKTELCEYCGAPNPDYSSPKHITVEHPTYEVPTVTEPVQEVEARAMSIYRMADSLGKFNILFVLFVAVITSLVSLIQPLFEGCFNAVGGYGMFGGFFNIALMIICPISLTYSYYYFVRPDIFPPIIMRALIPLVWLLLQAAEIFLITHNLHDGHLQKY